MLGCTASSAIANDNADELLLGILGTCLSNVSSVLLDILGVLEGPNI